MKATIKSLSLLLMIFTSSGAFAQYKYDIGLRASSYEMERAQLEQRFHFDSPYSLVVTLATGGRSNWYSTRTPLYGNNLFDEISDQYYTRNNALKVGVQRKLSFLATNVFYAGTKIGVGFEEQNNRVSLKTYSISETASSEYPYYAYADELISSDISTRYSKALNVQLGLSFGMDVPISKRFSINAEIGLAGIYTNSLTYSYYNIDLIGSVSGGLRYQFGDREKSKK